MINIYMGLSISKICSKSSKKFKKMKRKAFRDKKAEIIYKQISGNDPEEVYKDYYGDDDDDDEPTYTIDINI